MGKLPYYIAVILFMFWIIGLLTYNVGGMIHLILVLAVFAILFGIIKESESN
jgi:hypothetical protein